MLSVLLALTVGIQALAVETAVQTDFAITGSRDTGSRYGETPLCDLVADSIRWFAVEKAGFTIDAAVINGGCVRADIPAGTITSAVVSDTLPFGNTVCVVEVTGQQLLEAMEAACQQVPDGTTAFPQVSGIEYMIDANVPFKGQGASLDTYPGGPYYKPQTVGERVKILNVGGKQFSAAKTYRIATNDYLMRGGDAYYTFPNAASKDDTHFDMVDALLAYLQEGLSGQVPRNYASTDERITVVTDGPVYVLPQEMRNGGAVYLTGYEESGRLCSVKQLTEDYIRYSDLPKNAASFRLYCVDGDFKPLCESQIVPLMTAQFDTQYGYEGIALTFPCGLPEDTWRIALSLQNADSKAWNLGLLSEPGETAFYRFGRVSRWEAGEYRGLRVEAIDEDYNTLAAFYDDTISLTVTEGTAKTQPTATFFKSVVDPRCYDMTVSGTDSVCQYAMFFSMDGISANDWSTFNTSAGTWVEGISEYIEDGYYRIREVSDIAVADSKTASYSFADTSDWLCGCDSIQTTAATRVWLVEQLCDFLNIDTSAYKPSKLTFTDCVDLTDAQKRAVLAAVDKGIAASASPAEFAPYGEVNRAQGAVILSRMAGIPSVGSTWAESAVDYLYSIGAIPDTESFNATAALQQQEFAAWLECMRAYYTPENLRFEIRDGVGYLDWDGPEGNSLLYNIETRDSLNDSWYRLTRKEQSETTVHEYGGTCFGFRVAAVLNGFEVAAVADSALKSVANRDSTVQEVTSATFMRTNTDPLTYRADVTGVAGYPLVLLDVEGANGRDAWRSVTGGNNKVSITVYDDDDIVADGEYRVWGYSNYALSDDGKTITYDTCTLNSPKPCAPDIPTPVYSVSNICFVTDQETGLPALAWDFGGAAADEVHFRVIGIRSDGSLYNGMGTDRPQVSLAFDAGSYTRFEVQMRSRADNRLLASATADLTLTVTQDTDDLRADMIFYDLGNDEYLVSITGMNGYNNYHAYMRDTQNSGDGFYGWVDGSGASARIYFDGNRLLANRSCEVYGMTDYVLTSSTQASYHTALVYSSATPNIQPYTITNIRFETIGGLPQLAWDAPVVAGTRFRVFTNRTGNGGYKYDVGGTGNYLSMPVTIQESGEYEGMLVQAYYRDIPLKFACDDLLCVSVNSASAAASAAVDITKENNGRYRVDASGFTGYDVYSIKFALDPNGPDWRIGSFGETEGENTVTAYFNDEGTYCEDGYYRICAIKNYALSGDNKTLSFDLVVLNDWTPCGE